MLKYTTFDIVSCYIHDNGCIFHSKGISLDSFFLNIVIIRLFYIKVIQIQQTTVS